MLSSLFNEWPLRRQIILFTGGAILLFGCGAAEFVRQNEARAFEHNFRTQTDKLVKVLAATSLDAILSEDRPVLDTTIASLIETDPDVEAVSIFDEADELLTEWKRNEAADMLAGSSYIDFTRDVVFEGDSYGRFDISWNLDRQHAKLAEFGQRIYLYAAGLSALLALMIVGLVNGLVGSPIRAIYRQLKSLKGGEDIEPLKVSAARELVNLGDSVNELGQVLELRRAKEIELEELARAKSELLANMSHELRTPMNGVLGMLNLLADSPLNQTQAGQVRVAASSGQSLLRLINDILDFSKVEAGKLEFESIAFDLENLMEETVEVMAGQAHAKGLDIDCRIDGNLGSNMVGDPTRIKQVLTNLIGNAIKFTSEGWISVSVLHDQSRGPSQPGTVRFIVEDTGIGIPSDALADVFDSFKQADGSTTRLHGGTGLGLAISRQLIEGMGGQIGVDSTLNKGSSFWVEMDLQATGVTVEERARQAVQGKLPGQALVVDKALYTVDGIVMRLSEIGVQAAGCTSGEEALKQLRTHHASGAKAGLVIIGRELDDMPGEVLHRSLKSDPAFDNVKFVALTYITGETDSYFSDGESGVVETLARPVGRGSLVRLFSGQDPAVAKQQRDRAMEIAERIEAFGHLTILVVEDNPVNQEVALGMLEKLGFNAIAVDNGQEGLDRLEQRDIALVLMDCQMPVLDGYAATRQLREREEAGGEARLPVIALTANAMQGDTEKCLAAGMDDYLAKPFEPARLEEKLLHWLEPQSAIQEQDEPPVQAAGGAA